MWAIGDIDLLTKSPVTLQEDPKPYANLCLHDKALLPRQK